MARRGFLRYLYDQAELAQHDKSSLLVVDDERMFAVKPTVSFHLFSTRPPCGDATIVTNGRLLKNTGAKLVENLPGDQVDKLEPRLTRVRHKPGRGEPTLSASCSDKLARWLRVGIQGALLDMLLREPVKIKSIIVGGDGPFCVDSLKRALVRNEDSATIPQIFESQRPFSHAESEGKTPSYRSIVWCKVKERQVLSCITLITTNITAKLLNGIIISFIYFHFRPLEIAVEGRRLGTTKKNRSRSFLCVAKKSLFGKFLNVYRGLHRNELEVLKDTTYGAFKSKSLRYYTSWNTIKQTVFEDGWPKKNRELLKFYAPDGEA